MTREKEGLSNKAFEKYLALRAKTLKASVMVRHRQC